MAVAGLVLASVPAGGRLLVLPSCYTSLLNRAAQPPQADGPGLTFTSKQCRSTMRTEHAVTRATIAWPVRCPKTPPVQSMSRCEII